MSIFCIIVKRRAFVHRVENRYSSQEMFDTEGENYSAPIIDKLCLFIILMSILNFVKVFITKKHTEAQALFHIFSNF